MDQNIENPNRRRFNMLLALGLAANLVPWQQTRAGPSPLRGYIRTNWGRDTFSFGSYSYIAKGASRQDIQHLQKPLANKLFFAGEAVHPDYNSTVHAAYESGLMAAKKIQASRAKHIAVIGAGVSGLAAAKALADKGKKVSVYEARDRIGGRIWTDHRLGFPLDLGASWIHGIDDNPVYELASSLGLAMDKTRDSYVIRDSKGREIDEYDAPEWLENTLSIQNSMGAAVNDINHQAYLFDDDYGGAEVTFRRGYAGVLEALKGDYALHLECVVNKIGFANKRGVTIGFDKAEDVEADAVLLTVPLGVLKQGVINFEPSLPKRKQQAIDRLGMGVLDKLYLWFDEPFWDKNKTWIATPETGLPRAQLNEWFNLYPYIGQPVLLAFNGGPAAHALSGLEDEALVKKALGVIYSAYGQLPD